MPASSPPVSVSSGRSQGSSTSGVGSSASSTSLGLANGQNGAVVGHNGSAVPMGVVGVGGVGAGEQLSRTNLYIRGLPPNTCDKDLLSLCGK